MKFIIALITAGLSLIPASKPAKIDGYDFKKGEKYELKVSMDQQVTQSAMGQTMETKSKIETIEEMEVLDVSGDVFTIKITGKKRYMNMSIPTMGDQVMDSDGSGPMDQPFKIMTGKSYTIKMNRIGKVLEIEGLEEMVKTMKEEFSGTQFAAQAGQLLSVYEKEALMNTLTTQFLIYPENGENEWSQSSTMVVGNIPVELSTELSYKDDKTIYGEGKVGMDGDISTMGMTMQAKMDGTQQTIIDLASNGVPSKIQTIQEAEGELEAQGQKIPMSISTESTTTYVKL